MSAQSVKKPQAVAERKGIQSIEVGGRLLKVLSIHSTPMLLGDIAREAGMTPSKAHPYLASFCKIQMIEQDPSSGRYQLGALALRLGLAGLRQCPTLRRAASLLEDLKHLVGHTTAAAVWSQHGPMIVHLNAVDFPFAANLRVGTVMSMLGTATGRLFAAFLPPTLTRHLIEEELKRFPSEAKRRSAAKQFDFEVAEVKKHGMARVEGNPIPSVSALCAPVFNEEGSLALALLVTGTASSFNVSYSGSIAQALQRTCTLASEPNF